MSATPFDRSRRAALVIWSALLATLAGWHALAHGAGIALLGVLTTVVPPLAAVPGLWRGLRQTYRWAPLTLAPGLAWSLTEFVANPPERPVALAAALLACLALAAVVAALRCLRAAP